MNDLGNVAEGSNVASGEASPPIVRKGPRTFPRVCPECGETFIVTAGRGSHRRFCTPAHKLAFGNRCAARGKVLMPYLMAWRTGRPSGGQKSSPVVKDSFAEIAKTLDRFAEEDRKAGRPKLADYVGGLLATGFTTADRADNFGCGRKVKASPSSL